MNVLVSGFEAQFEIFGYDEKDPFGDHFFFMDRILWQRPGIFSNYTTVIVSL